jgi:hypothetical protein
MVAFPVQMPVHLSRDIVILWRSINLPPELDALYPWVPFSHLGDGCWSVTGSHWGTWMYTRACQAPGRIVPGPWASCA